MASLPLSVPQWQPQQRSAPQSSAPKPSAMVGTAAPAARLSALEWSIVAMAERDPLSSIREHGRFITALESIFGLKRAGRLANERLEALRRVAILIWHHRWNVPKSEVAAFLAAGFSADHFELIQTSIGQARPARRRRTAW
ncbi:MAG: hypothetical protein ABIO69_09280 [Sphingomicrobium sp.]